MRMPVEMEKKYIRDNRDKIVAYPVGHLPIIKEFSTKLGIVEVINQMVPSQMMESPGTVFLGLIMDTLSGRSPLYRLDDFFDNQDTELLLGNKVRAEAFCDYNVARVLDKTYDAGTMKIFTELSKRAVLQFGVDTKHVSFDTTSVNVFGEYNQCSDTDADVPFRITYGHSKDHRPDLKQFLISLLCVDKNIPIVGKIESGNESDKNINNTVLSSVSKHLAKCGIEQDGFIYIADSAMVTEDNLAQAGDSIKFITRLPATYNECGKAISDAIEKDQWEQIGVLAETKPTKNRPATFYKAFESSVELYGKTYRAVVVHSSSHDKRRQKKIDRQLDADFKDAQGRLKNISKKEFYCLKDANKAKEELIKDNKYYCIDAQVKEVPIYKRGRPKDGIKQVDRVMYSVTGTVVEKTHCTEKLRKEAGCFVLLTNVEKQGEQGYTAKQILKAYKDQHGIERNFGFLKDPVIVNSIFLKKPERIEVLGLVLLLSLLVWRLIEREMRQYIQSTGNDLPGWKNRRTTKPTSFMLMTKFAGIIVLVSGTTRTLNRPMTKQQKQYLFALGIRNDAFVNPQTE